MRWLFGRGNAPRAPVLVALLVLLNALALRVVDPPALVRLRDSAFDAYQRLKPREVEADLPVHIIDIDEAALAEYGQWPWPRTLVADLVDKLAEAGVAVIAFDVVFSEADRSSLRVLARSLPEEMRDTDMRRMMEALPDNDEVLAEALAKAPVVTGFAFDSKGKTGAPRKQWGVAHNTGEGDAKAVGRLIAKFIPQETGSVRSLEVLELSGKGNGGVTTGVESSVIRHVPMLFRFAGQRNEDLFPALSIESVRVAQEGPPSTYIVHWAGSQGMLSFGGETGIGWIHVGGVDVHTDGLGRVTLFDSGHRDQRFISAKDVLSGKVPPDKLAGNIVFVGTSAVGLKDLRNTPTEDNVPGVEIHAQLVEQMLTKTYLDRPDYADGTEFIYLLAIGLAFVLLLPRLSASTMAVVAVGFIAVGVAVPFIAYAQARLLFDPVYPPATLAAIYISGSALAFMRAERDRKEIRGAFNLYLSPAQVEAVVRNPDLLALGGEQREITVMFTDMRGFTRISEQFDPQGLTRFMNRFLTPMTDLILGTSGTIDKYMGDAIMAFWNAPLPVEFHAVHACRAALGMQSKLLELNKVWEEEAKALGNSHIPVNIGVGLNTGLATVGNFGSAQRLTYSCLGDEVNLASRLEGQCKTYGVGIIIGSNTAQQVPDFATLEIDLVIVKGKTEPERIFALVGDVTMAKSPEFTTLVDRQSAFLVLYRTGSFAEALDAIRDCARAADALGWKQTYYDAMRERVDGLIDDSPVDWNGVYVAKDK
jgi:adenylate cyclase